MSKLLNQVETAIRACVDGLARERCLASSQQFLDPATTKSTPVKEARCFFTTCETLEVLFQPMIYLNLGPQLFKKYPRLKGRICSDFDFLFKVAKDKKWKFFSGAPYLGNFGKKTYEPANSIESLGYFIAVCVHLLKTQELLQVPLSVNTEANIINGIENSLRTLLSSHTGQGWPLILKQRTQNIYSTWSILETLDELEFQKPQIYRSFINNTIEDQTASWLESQLRIVRNDAQKLLDRLPKERDYKLTPTLRKTTCLYYLVHAATGLHLLGKGSPTLFGRVVADLLNQKTYFLSEDFPTRYPHNLDDYTLIPLLLRCLCVILQYHLRVGIVDNAFVNGLGQIYEQKDLILYDLFWKLLSEKRTVNKVGRYNGLFYEPDPERPQDDTEWELFYTQRTVEALLSYRAYLQDPEIARKSVKPHSIRRAKVRGATAKAKMLSAPKVDLPALTAYTETLLGRHGTVLSKYVIVCVQHFLLDLPPFVESLIRLGAMPKDIFLLRKTYAYPDANRVENVLKSRGCRIYKQPPIPSKWVPKRRQLLKLALKAAHSSRKRIVILEDGGYFVPLVHNEFQRDLAQFVGAVEQTTRGLRNDKALRNDLALPVVNVAKSKLKSKEEGPAVAQTLADNIYNVCVSNAVSYRPGATTVLVLGYGTIGASTAKKLRDKGFQVTVYDSSQRRSKDAQANNFNILRRRNDFRNFRVVLGVTGNRSMPLNAIISLPNNAIIASGSSEYHEIDMEALENITLRPKTTNIRYDKQTKLTSYQVSRDKQIRVLCDGEPINFSLSGGIPNVMIQPILMQLLWGTVAVTSGEAKPGKNMLAHFPTKVESEIVGIRNRLEG